MTEFRIKRTELMGRQPAPQWVRWFDQVARDRGDSADLVWPDGWTELHSFWLYQLDPQFHQWLMNRGLIPRDQVARRFPGAWFQRVYSHYPDPSGRIRVG